MTAPTSLECTHCGTAHAELARFCDQCGARLVKDEDERRPLAVLFCDIVGSTNYLRKLGPEDWLSILRDFHETTRRVVLHFGGYVAQHLGDGVLVYVGFPRAHDDDARRAVETGLGIVAAISALNTRLIYRGWPELRVRIGIATGRSLVGSVSTGSDTLAHGEIPHLAARLQSMADPDTVLVDGATHDLVKGFFRCEAVVGRAPRDFPRVALHVVRERTDAQTRMDISTARGLSPFVGRALELRFLADSWEHAAGGERRSILIKGEAGIGKTRLVQMFNTGLGGADHVFQCRASPYHQNRALYPIVDMLERTLGLLPGESNDSKLGKLERWLSGSSALGLAMLPILAPLFAVSLPADSAEPDLAPQKRRQLVFESIVRWLEFLGKRGTILLVIEDVHWADPSTLELMRTLLGAQSNCGLLLLLTARPEFENPLGAGCAELELERLSDSETETIVASMTPNHTVSPNFLQFVFAKAEGVPLFTEELTRTLLETGAFESESEPPSSRGGSAFESEIPSTLSGLLMTRLDRLGHARKTAQLAAAIGRDFRFEVLSEVSSLDRETLAADFRELVDKDVIHASVGSTGSYAFKHALVRDAAYDLMSSRAREDAHARIAAAIERRFPEVVKTQPDLLAYHYAAAGQTPKALGFAQRAAEEALQRSAYAEAIAHASNVSLWCDTLNHPERAEAELSANGVLSQAMMFTRGWADPEVKAIADRSAALLHELDALSPHRVPTLWSLFAYHHTASNRRAARAAAEELVAVAESSGDKGFQAAAAALLGITLHPEGNFTRARSTLETAIELYDPELHRNQGPEIGLDSLVLSKALLAHLHWFAGDAGSAYGLVAEALAWARSIGHIPSLAIGLLYGCQVYQFAGDRAAVAEMTSEILSLAKKYGLPAYEGYAAIVHAWATRNERLAESVLTGLKTMGCNLCLSYFASLAAENLAESGSLDTAIARLDYCLSLCQANDEHYYEPELHRRRAMCELGKGAATDSVRASLQRAAELAELQNMPQTAMRARQELSARFGCSASSARLEELIASHPALRDDVNRRPS